MRKCILQSGNPVAELIEGMRSRHRANRCLCDQWTSCKPLPTMLNQSVNLIEVPPLMCGVEPRWQTEAPAIPAGSVSMRGE